MPGVARHRAHRGKGDLGGLDGLIEVGVCRLDHISRRLAGVRSIDLVHRRLPAGRWAPLIQGVR